MLVINYRKGHTSARPGDSFGIFKKALRACRNYLSGLIKSVIIQKSNFKTQLLKIDFLGLDKLSKIFQSRLLSPDF